MNDAFKDDKPTVLVMMASYNGEKFIDEQIDSILAQKDVHVTLRICDDGSNDSTPSICESYASKYDNVLFEVNKVNKGLAKNFMDMVYDDKALGFNYYAFSDQDDVWLPEKLIHAIRQIEAQVHDEPALYYSDIENVNCDLSGGSREFSSWIGCSQWLIAALTVNWASGCTMVFNSQLREQIITYEPRTYPRIHDSWIHLIAMVSGAVVADLGDAYIKRRISGDNQVGQRNLESTESFKSVATRWKRIIKKSTHCQTRVAAYLLDGYENVMGRDEANLVRTYAKMPTSLYLRIKIGMKLLHCPFPTRSMARAFAIKAVLNRL